MPTALATPVPPPPTITIAGVQIHGNFKSNGAQTTFLSSDPVFGDFCYELQPPARTNGQSPYVGVNIPARGTGTLTDFGSLEVLEHVYDVPNLGPPADAGLRYFIQTSDGFIHTAAGTSRFLDSNNGANAYGVGLVPPQFTPLITLHEVPTSLNIRYTNTVGTIFFVGVLIEGANLVESTPENFNFNTVNDTAFNN